MTITFPSFPKFYKYILFLFFVFKLKQNVFVYDKIEEGEDWDEGDERIKNKDDDEK